MELNFYQTNEELSKVVAPLAIKILEEKKRVLIFTKSEKLIREIDSSMWSHGRNKFIPHITIFDVDFDLKRQPILITNKEENANEADYLIFFDEPSKNFISTFQRAFHFFSEASYKGDLKAQNFYKKQDGKWVKG